MRLADLERESGVPSTAIKYYLREGLLPRGRILSATRAEYSEEHLRRLRLIRALVHGAGLSIQQVHDVVAAVDNPTDHPNPFRTAQEATIPDMSGVEIHPWVSELAAERQWPAGTVKAQAMLSRAIQTMQDAGLVATKEELADWAEAMSGVADVDVNALSDNADSQESLLKVVIAGTLASDNALLALRRLEQATLTAKRMGPFPD